MPGMATTLAGAVPASGAKVAPDSRSPAAADPQPRTVVNGSGVNGAGVDHEGGLAEHGSPAAGTPRAAAGGPSLQAASVSGTGAPATPVTVDPDYEVPRGAMTETQVLLHLAAERNGGRPMRLDAYGFVVALGQDPDSAAPAAGAAAAAEAAAGGRPASGAAASTSGRPTSASPARGRPTSAEGSPGERLRKWRKMLGPGGAGLAEYRRRRPEKLKRRIRKGIPQPLRGLAWHVLSGGLQLRSSNPGLFAQLLEEAGPGGLGSPGAESNPGPKGAGPGARLDPKVEGDIMRDLNRTFPTHIYFMQRQGPGQRALYDVLRAYALYDKGVGYVQGMGFVAAVLLLHMDSEEAFWTLVAVMQGPLGAEGGEGLRRMYLPGLPGLWCSLYQFKLLLVDECPGLAAHLEAEGLDPELFATHWFNTAWAYTLPFPHLLRVWDVFVAEGPKTLFRVALALMAHAAPRLQPLPFERLAEALSAKNLPALLPASPDELLKPALRIPASARLEQLQAEWEAAHAPGQRPHEQGVAAAAARAAKGKRKGAAGGAGAGTGKARGGGLKSVRSKGRRLLGVLGLR
ncbi:hypothetical protein HYH03_011114 [Edaphochlamys debaryana]|uniref:Rab-GAP TBC domain-containing protein n=1 Tax=Edaphochlamys debaryana TaxID=47281 RepID=A0A835XVC5_9CHLO|nr:hypothetical protein HYH03_011114 [Edaphochlamys debaryana]|eukprot:KAG2490485.1 hypothetical protein HYH03_011114 [Edaphochlamys debaryana]